MDDTLTEFVTGVGGEARLKEGFEYGTVRFAYGLDYFNTMRSYLKRGGFVVVRSFEGAIGVSGVTARFE